MNLSRWLRASLLLGFVVGLPLGLSGCGSGASTQESAAVTPAVQDEINASDKYMREQAQAGKGKKAANR